jgi:hypothetical protein
MRIQINLRKKEDLDLRRMDENKLPTATQNYEALKRRVTRTRDPAMNISVCCRQWSVHFMEMTRMWQFYCTFQHLRSACCGNVGNTCLWSQITKNSDFFDVLLTVHLSIFISVFNQLDASTCFEHMCSKHVEAWNKSYCETNFVHQVG